MFSPKESLSPTGTNQPAFNGTPNQDPQLQRLCFTTGFSQSAVQPINFCLSAAFSGKASVFSQTSPNEKKGVPLSCMEPVYFIVAQISISTKLSRHQKAFSTFGRKLLGESSTHRFATTFLKSVRWLEIFVPSQISSIACKKKRRTCFPDSSMTRGHYITHLMTPDFP